jgi:putative molybdopterin biosynthesis protein
MTDYTISEFAQVMGVSRPTIWKYIGLGKINAYKVGRAVRIPHDEYDRFTSSNRILAKSEEI